MDNMDWPGPCKENSQGVKKTPSITQIVTLKPDECLC